MSTTHFSLDSLVEGAPPACGESCVEGGHHEQPVRRVILGFFLARSGPNPLARAQPPDSPLRHGETSFMKFISDKPIPKFRFNPMSLPSGLSEVGLFYITIADGPSHPLIRPLLRQQQHPTCHRNRNSLSGKFTRRAVGCLPLSGKDYFGIASRAKYAAARLSISISCRALLNSRWILCNSGDPATSPDCVTLAALIHLCKHASEIPKSLATCALGP
jgi:hypothetical protein